MHRGMPSLNVLDCGAKAHCATAKNSPSGLKQFGRLILHFAKRHNVSAMIHAVTPRCNCGLFRCEIEHCDEMSRIKF